MKQYRQIYKNDKTLMYIYKQKSNIKNISAKVNNDNELEVVFPIGISIEFVDDFIMRHFDKFYEFIKKRNDERLLDFTKDVIYIKAQKYNIKIQETKSRQKYEIINNNIYLFLTTPDNKKQMIKKIFKDVGEQYILKLAKKIAQNIGIKNVTFKTKWYDSKWGQCNVANNEITLASQLIMFTDDIIEYVIIHELCHLTHPNHSPEFWSLVEKYCPKYNWARQKLKYQT